MADLRNHAPDIASMDLFVVPTIGFDLLYAFIIVRLDRRNLVWISVTANPTAEWVAHQITEAFPWNEVPKYLLRDREADDGKLDQDERLAFWNVLSNQPSMRFRCRRVQSGTVATSGLKSLPFSMPR